MGRFNIWDFLTRRLGVDGVALYYELCYWWIGWRRTIDPLTTLNFGYAPVSDAVSADPLYKEPFQVELYEQVAHAVGKERLRGRRLLEISCGLAGGFDHLLRHCGLGHGVLVDRSLNALRLADRRYGLRGVRADAHKLPFARGSFDVVINVEASHMYTFAEFASQVAAVLSPGGLLCIADYRHGRADAVEARLGRELARAGFKVNAFRDVTENIVESLRLNTARRDAYMARVPWPVRGSFRQWSAIENTPQYDRLKARQDTYFILVAQR